MNDLVLLGVGASGGIHRRWKSFAPSLNAILFEPDERAYQQLLAKQSGSVQVVNAALFQHPGEYPFYRCQKQEVSSNYRPNFELINRYPEPERFAVVETARMEMTTLDQFSATPTHRNHNLSS